MSDLMRTTIVFPEELLKLAKMRALEEGKSLSGLVRESLEEKLVGGKKSPPILKLGKYSLGIKDSLSRRKLYGQRLQRKISY